MLQAREGTAAVRDFDPAYVGSGSSSTHAIEVTHPCLSALPQKRPPEIKNVIRRFVPQADIRIAANFLTRSPHRRAAQRRFMQYAHSIAPSDW
jgi:hypothetical protein